MGFIDPVEDTLHDLAQVEADVREMQALIESAAWTGPGEVQFPSRQDRLGSIQLESQVVLSSCFTHEPTTVYLHRTGNPGRVSPIWLTQSSDGTVTTHYPDGRTCACPVVPDDQVHADQLTRHLGLPSDRPYTAARHRLEHELWHHLVGFLVYGEESGSLIIWREAHGEEQPNDDRYHLLLREAYTGAPDAPLPVRFDKYWPGSPAHEEWLVAALLHHAHSDPSYDYGARHYLTVERGIDLDSPHGLLAIGRSILSPLQQMADDMAGTCA